MPAAELGMLTASAPGRLEPGVVLVADELRARFPALREPASDDICYATTNRQDALKTIADESDLVLVVGSANSSNSLRLVELARRHGTPGELIDDVSDIRPAWLAGVRVVGLTAGASAPPRMVEAVVAGLAGLGPVTVAERETARETIHFALPSVLKACGKADQSGTHLGRFRWSSLGFQR